MKIKFVFLIPLLFIILSCTKQDGLIVKDFRAYEVDLLKSSKDKIIIITNDMICHSCIINLDEYLLNKLDIKKYEYVILTEDLRDTPSRRMAVETYKNIYTPHIDKVFFTKEDSLIQARLCIPKKIFKQPTPYVIFIGKNKEPKYYPSQDIFNSNGSIKESFRMNVK